MSRPLDAEDVVLIDQRRLEHHGLDVLAKASGEDLDVTTNSILQNLSTLYSKTKILSKFSKSPQTFASNNIIAFSAIFKMYILIRFLKIL